ncbi:MAG: flagellar motor protein MotB [Candidatus Schekmanbacteria bacterium]|nr:flagellar motor protein MotB [Candidatus Schekmanbacteria bacterium]
MKKKGGHDEGGGGGHGGGGLRWLVTYADMITLLLAVFIVLYAMSTLDLRRYKSTISAFKNEFSGGKMVLSGGSGILEGNPDPSVFSVDRLGPPSPKTQEATEKAIKEFLKNAQMDGTVSVKQEERGTVVSVVSDKVFFGTGSADVSSQAAELLKKLLPVIKGSGRQIRVEGHTCNLPTRSRFYPSNLELSTARATAVARALIKQGVDPSLVSTTGYGENRPKVPNDSPANREKNRRVDIVLLSDKAAAMEPGAESAGTVGENVDPEDPALLEEIGKEEAEEAAAGGETKEPAAVAGPDAAGSSNPEDL